MLGIDYLGGAKFGDLILREHPEGWAAGFFANTFGNAWPVIEKLAATGRCPRIRVHAVWSDTHTYRPQTDDRVIIKELERASSLQARYPNVDIQFSPFCEHNIKGRQLTELWDRIRKNTSLKSLVNSTWNGDMMPQLINEVHGDHPDPGTRYNYSFDGLSSVDTDVNKLRAQHFDAETFYFWHPAMNGKLKADDKTPREKRKSWPTSELIDSLIYLSRDVGEVRMPKGFLWKSHSDRHSTPPEPRAYKPVLISPIKSVRAELVADNGQIIAVSSGAQPFEDGRVRYYWPQFGYQMAEKARRIHGKATAQLRLNGKVFGTVNPAFRAGSFRD